MLFMLQDKLTSADMKRGDVIRGRDDWAVTKQIYSVYNVSR